MILIEHPEVYGWEEPILETGRSDLTRVAIAGFPNYTIDEFGNVYNREGLKLKAEVTSQGYLRVSLSNESVKHKRLSIHRLVAETFIPNPGNLQQVNHIDENKLNNHVSNLEWITPLGNLLHSGVIDKASVAKKHKIRCVTTGEVYDSILDAVNKYGLHHSNIVACCMGRRKTCGGMVWEYA